MKKIKKVLLLLIAFSFTLLSFNTQAYAVEYYEFEFTVTDVSNTNDVQYTPITLYNDLKSFLIEYGSYDNVFETYTLIFNGGIETLIYNDGNGEVQYLYDTPELEYDIMIDYTFTMYTEYINAVIPVGSYIIVTDIPITFTVTFWDNIIDAIDEASTALTSAASAGFGLIYDGVGLTALGSALVIPIGLGLVLGVFYLIIRMLPSVRL